MKKTNWKQKLTSRKFWAAVIGFVVTATTALNIDALSAEQVTTMGWAAATLIAYIVGEGLVDAMSNRTITHGVEVFIEEDSADTDNKTD